MSAKKEQKAGDKPRADSKLKTLPAERQGQVYERLCLPAPDGTLEGVRDWLRADGFETSTTALHEFRRWYRLELQFARAGDFATQMAQALNEEQPQLDATALESYAQRVFQARALEMEMSDPEGAAIIWERMQRLKLKATDQLLEERKIALLEKRAAQAEKAQAVAEDTTLSPEQISAKIKGIFGITG